MIITMIALKSRNGFHAVQSEADMTPNQKREEIKEILHPKGLVR